MAIYTQLPENLGQVDVIIAGGGTAGCIIAARLSDADPDLVIMVIEGGPDNFNMPTVVHPGLFLSHLAPGSKTAHFYKGNKSPSTADRDIFVPAGSVLGGGSSINFLIYSRAKNGDFDSWNTPGWSAKDMVPYLKKLETYHGTGSPKVHGDSGPVNISRGGFNVSRLEDDFIDAASGLGWPEIEDLQDLGADNGVQRSLRYVSPEGKRQDAAHTYLHPRLRDGLHPNLHVLVESQVDRVILENKKAVGVTFRRNPSFLDDGEASTNPVKLVRARRFVVVSCGGCGTPLVLERSGVGSSSVLTKADVPVVAEVPGVGNQFRDHPGVIYAYRSALEEGETMDAFIRSFPNVMELVEKKDPMLAWNAMDVTSKVRPCDADIAALGSDFHSHWDREYKNFPERPMSILSLINCFPGVPIGVPPGQYMGVSTFTTYPLSRGHIHITGSQIDDPLDFETGYLTDSAGIDIKEARWTYKAQREVMRRMKAYRGEWAPWHPPFPADSNAACGPADGPVPKSAPRIEYSAEDDAVIDQWLRDKIDSFWHPQGTCKMGPLEDGGVVDSSLSVYGVEGLKVADMSITPKHVAANTNNTALAIGERAADIFIQELGLSNA
ncbi:alcohol oxidase-like protein [Xylariales sp. PMI_506]|nr:alcohol oxidase-like protein [Xylariales sp. PMI_506]